MTWLVAAPPEAGPARWFTRRQAVLLWLGSAALALVVLPMIWPFLPADGPARIIYWLHDEVVLPVYGRFVLRYWPWPVIGLTAFAVLVVLGWVLRRRFDSLQSAATRWALGQAGWLRVLAAWAGRRRRLLHLHAEADLKADECFAAWVEQRSDSTLVALREATHQATVLLAALPPRARAEEAGTVLRLLARLAIAETLAGKTEGTAGAELMKMLPLEVQGLARKALAGPHEVRARLSDHRKIWDSALRAPSGVAGSLFEALILLAIAQALRTTDTAIADTLQIWHARLRFEARLDARSDQIGDVLRTDPVWWDLMASLRLDEPVLFGVGPSVRTTSELRRALARIAR